VAPVKFADLDQNKRKELLSKIFELVPSGVGRGHKNIRGLSDRDYDQLLRGGARWSVEQGFGFEDDLKHSESNGCLEDADPSAISDHAKERGKVQLGTIGSGNHFVEVGAVDTLTLHDVAKEWRQKGVPVFYDLIDVVHYAAKMGFRGPLND